MKKPLLFACLAAAGLSVQAQSCEGGLYLNPQVIRGEGSSQTESALRELIEFIKPTGLSTAPVLNIRETQDVLTAIKKPAPPCWVAGATTWSPPPAPPPAPCRAGWRQGAWRCSAPPRR